MNEKAKIISIRELISLENLKIPEYQRPYKWTTKNINQLIDDILNFNNKESYRLGTIVLQEDEEQNNIEPLELNEQNTGLDDSQDYEEDFEEFEKDSESSEISNSEISEFLKRKSNTQSEELEYIEPEEDEIEE